MPRGRLCSLGFLPLLRRHSSLPCAPGEWFRKTHASWLPRWPARGWLLPRWDASRRGGSFCGLSGVGCDLSFQTVLSTYPLPWSLSLGCRDDRPPPTIVLLRGQGSRGAFLWKYFYKLPKEMFTWILRPRDSLWIYLICMNFYHYESLSLWTSSCL